MTQTSDTFHYDISEETFQCRTKIRSSGYLQNPQEKKPLTCLNKDEVDYDLINFSINAKENIDTYIAEYEKDGQFGKGPVKLKPIFVLQQDREKYFDMTKKSKATLIKEITNTLEKIDTTMEGIVLSQQWESEIKKGTKDDFVAFYKEVLQAVDEATFTADAELDDGDNVY